MKQRDTHQWTVQDQQLFQRLYKQYKNDFSEYLKFFPQRTYQQIRCFYYNQIYKYRKTNNALDEQKIQQQQADSAKRATQSSPVNTQQPINPVAIIFDSVGGSTLTLAEMISKELYDQGISYYFIDLRTYSIEQALATVQSCSKFILGSPTYNGSMLDSLKKLIQQLIYQKLHLNKKFALFGTFGWTEAAVNDMKTLLVKDGTCFVGSVVTKSEEVLNNLKAVKDLIFRLQLENQ
ncbi:A-type_flavoprotein 6 [Hexamita inflata]|uniref:A-type flavoprotein 6 n=1 Tax=Hexamita inflata TaxID=28002 RepID=A0AA86PCF1_9EUKA|nr:A-type flavoprotein 6 [Hexamita inflata]